MLSQILTVQEAEQRLLDALRKTGRSPRFQVKLPRPVGVDIFDTVSGDLYKNPFHVVRELIQNSYDESANTVELFVTGGSVVVKDDGRGMDFPTLLSTRRLCESEKVYNPDKYPNPVRGFRKLGIYSGYQIAGRLDLRTKQAGDEFEMILRLDFDQMRREALENRKRFEDERWGVDTLIEACTSVEAMKIDPEVDIQASYTVAQLVNVHVTSPEAWAKLSDSAELSKYLVQTFSLDFDPGFKYRARINAYLAKYVPGFHPFTIKLSTAEGMDVVKRPAITDVDEVRLVRIPQNSPHPLALGWIGRRKDHALADPSAKGIVFKVGGITIGSREAALKWSRGEHGYLNNRLTGEFHVIDPDIKPDPERASFSPSPKTEELFKACKTVVTGVVADVREDRKAKNEQERTEDNVKKLTTRWAALKPSFDDPPKSTSELLKLVSEAGRLSKELNAAQIAVSEPLAAEASKTIQEIERTLPQVLSPIPVAQPQPRRGGESKTSLVSCLTREDLESRETVSRFLGVVEEVLREELGTKLKPVIETIRQRWIATAGGRTRRI